MKREEDTKQVVDLLSWWAHLVKIRAYVGFTDINKLSEGLAERILNAFYGLKLVNLNYETINIPGIDLGDQENRIAFQITSQTNNRKIIESLEKVRSEDRQRYSKGIRFLLVSLDKKPNGDPERARKIVDSFEPAKDILNVADLAKEACRIYDAAPERFKQIQKVLVKAFPDQVEKHARSRLEDLPLDRIPPIAPLPEGSLMPFASNPLFVGREEDLKMMAQALKGGQTTALGQVAAALGLGGIGKTQLAIQFAHHYGQYFAGVFWLNFGAPESIHGEVARCGGKSYLDLRPDFDQLKEPDQVNLVLAHWQNGLPWLLVFDNCEQADLLIKWRPPSGAARVLVTSRCSVWSPELGVIPVPVWVLARNESKELLQKTYVAVLKELYPKQKIYPELPGQNADAIAEELGDFPLALHLAGCYLAQYKFDTKSAQYLEQLKKSDLLDHFSLTREEKEKLTGHDLHVARTFSLSLNRLQESDPLDSLARRVLAGAACLAPGSPIPRQLLYAILDIDAENEATRYSITDAVRRLRQVGLVEEMEDGSLLLHRLLAAFARTLAEAAVHERVESALVGFSYQVDESGLPQDFSPLEPHLRQVAEAAEKRGSSQMGVLYINLASHLDKMARYAEAEPLMRRALAIWEQSLGEDHPKVATALNNLAQLLKATNRLAEAEPLMRRVLAIDETSFGQDHPSVATDLNNLACLLQDTNRLAEAEPLYRRALVIDETRLGKDHPNVAICLNNLAALLQDTNRLAQAEPLMRRVVSIMEKSFGEDHPNVATALNNLALLFKDTNRLAEAEQLMRRVLAIDEMSFGKDHPKVAIRLNNLAALLQATNRLTEAEPLYHRALAIDEKSFGKDHPKVVTDLNNLAQLLKATNRLAEAEQLMRRVLAIDEMSFGQDHPKVAIRLNNLAVLLQDTNRLAEAEPLYRRALAIDETSFGKDHPKVATDLNNLAQLLKATNRLIEAEPLMRRVVSIMEKSFGEDHPNIATALNNLALLLQATNRLVEAEPLYRRALAIDEASFGKDHPNVAIHLNNLAGLLQDTNRLAEAEPLYHRALTIAETSFGKDHPNVAISLNNLAALLQDTNRLAEAEPLYRRALAIDETSFGKDHPKVATDLNNLAQLLKATNRLIEAEPLMRRVVSIMEKSFGEDHPNIATALNNLALLLQATNRLVEAEPLIRRQLEIFISFTRATGHPHPHLQAAVNNYTGLLQAMGRSREDVMVVLREMAPELFKD